MSMQAILNASQSMAKMQTIQSARTQMQNTSSILQIESKQDGGNKKKDDQAKALEESSNKLMDNMMKEAADVQEALKPDEDEKVEAEAKAEAEKLKEFEKNKKDTLELSDSAVARSSEEPYVKPAVGEAVTYKADGIATPSSFAKAAPTVNVTV